MGDVVDDVKPRHVIAKKARCGIFRKSWHRIEYI